MKNVLQNPWNRATGFGHQVYVSIALCECVNTDIHKLSALNCFCLFKNKETRQLFRL